MSGPEPAHRPLVQLEHRPVDLHRLEPLAPEDEPRPAEARRAARPDEPAAAHAQVAAQHDAALEAQQQVLADRLDGLEPQPVHALGDAGDRGARMRRLGLDPLPDERLETSGGAVQRIALGHASSVAPPLRLRHALGSTCVRRRAQHRSRRSPHGGRRAHAAQVGAALRRPRADADRGRPAALLGGRHRPRASGSPPACARATGSARRPRCSPRAAGKRPAAPRSCATRCSPRPLSTGKDGLDPLLDHAFTLYPLDQALRDVIAPCLVGIGDGWARGELSVGQEHLTSAAIRARLERTLAEPRGAVRGLAVLACAPGEQHELGLLMLACLLRADGWERRLPGPVHARRRRGRGRAADGTRRCSRSA